MPDLLALVAGAAILTATAVLVVAITAPRGLPATLTALGIAAYGAVVLAAEAVSLVGALDRAGLLVAQTLLLAVAALAWLKTGRPRIWTGPSPRTMGVSALAGARDHPLIAGICAIAAASMAIQLVVGLVAAPTNWDSMTYHLSRAAYWLQEGSALRFEGGSLRQLDSMPNAELATAWTMALSGGDRFVELVQWLALVTCVAAIAGLARFLNFTRAEAAAAGALFAVLPGPVLQSVTTQNDLVTAACIVATALFAARAMRDGQPGMIALAGASLGLGLGTKGAVLMALPALAIIPGAAAWRSRPSKRTLTTAAGAVAVGFVFFGAFQYTQNLVETGSPFGHQADLVGREQFGLSGNAARVLWNFTDSPGVTISVADRIFDHTVARVVRPTGDPVSVMRLGTGLDEDVIAAGLVGWLVLWPLTLLVLIWPRTRLERRAQAAAAISLALAIAVTIKATPFNGRILIPAMALAAPLLALVARRSAALGATSVLMLASLASCLLLSQTHLLLPERGKPFFFERDRIAQMTVLRPEQDPLIRNVESRFGSDRPLMFLGGEDSWDYPYFGADLSRRVVRVDPSELPRDDDRAMCAWLRERIERERVAGVLMVGAPTEVPAPPAAIDASQPSPSSYVFDKADVAAGCV
jgi:hypothetical protein